MALFQLGDHSLQPADVVAHVDVHRHVFVAIDPFHAAGLVDLADLGQGSGQGFKAVSFCEDLRYDSAGNALVLDAERHIFRVFSHDIARVEVQRDGLKDVVRCFLADDDFDTWLDDAGLVDCNFVNSIAESFAVVKSDARDCAQEGIDNVGRVDAPAYAHLETDEVAAAVLEVQKAHQSYYLKEGESQLQLDRE